MPQKAQIPGPPAEPASSRAAATLFSRRANGAQPAHRAALAGKAACIAAPREPASTARAPASQACRGPRVLSGRVAGQFALSQVLLNPPEALIALVESLGVPALLIMMIWVGAWPPSDEPLAADAL